MSLWNQFTLDMNTERFSRYIPYVAGLGVANGYLPIDCLVTGI